MSEASQNKQAFITSWEPGWVIKRSTAILPNAPLVLHNAFVNEDNTIIARGGIARINSTQLSDGGSAAGSRAVHSHYLHGGLRYVGVGSVIKRGIDPGVNIISGLNIRRCTMASMSPSNATSEQWTYFANGNFTTHGAATGDPRKKDNGAVTRNWGIEGPGAAPTIAISTSLPASTLIDNFNTPYTVIGTGTEALADEPYKGDARTFGVAGGETCRFRRNFATLNLSAYGEEGYIRLMLRFSRVADLDLVGLAFDVGDGTFTKDFYEITATEIGVAGDNTWEEIRILKADFVRTKSDTGTALNWSNVKAVQFFVSGHGDALHPFELSVDEMRLEAPTHPQGIVDYRVTFWNDTVKIRSNSRTLADVYSLTDRTSTTLNVNRQGVTVTRPPAPSDPQVTHWEVWRRNRKAAGIFQFVDRVPIATSSYVDTKSEIELGEGLVDDNHIPPPANFAVQFNDQMFLMGLPAQVIGGIPTGEEQAPYTIRYSRRFFPESFPLTNYILAGDPVDTIRGYAIWDNQLWIFTKKHIFRLVPVGDSYVAQETEAPVGTESPYSISPSPFGIFYFAPGDGPYLFNGSTSVPVGSQQIQPFFDGEEIHTDGIVIPVATPSTVTDYTNIVGQYHNRYYWLIVDDTTGTCRTLVYNAERQRWHRCSGKDFTFQRLSSEKAGDDTYAANNLEAGNSDGWLCLLDPVFGRTEDPGGEAIEVIIQQTFDTIMKPPDAEVDVKDIAIDANTGGQTVLIEASFDDSPLEIMSAGSALFRGKLFFPVFGVTGEPAEGRICYKVSVRITLQQRTFRSTFYGIGVDYWPEPRRSESYSAMYFAPREKAWARRGRFVLRSYAPVACELIFDDARNYTMALPNTNGRRLSTNPTLPTGMHGKVARVIFTSTAPFVVYPQSAIEIGVFGGPAQPLLWSMQP